MIPPAFGLRHVAKEIYTGDDTISYWNAYVAITQMHGHGAFADPRIGVSVNNLAGSRHDPKLAALREYQFSLNAPPAAARAPSTRGRRARAERCSWARRTARPATSAAIVHAT